MARRDFPEVAGYLPPTIGSTAVPSGATVTTVADLTLTNPTINNSALGYTTVATAGGTTTLTNTSNYHHIFTGLTSQIVVMPVASTLVVGTKYIIENNSTGGNVTVRSSGANTIATVLQGSRVEFTCILNSGTNAASWNAEFVGYSTNTGTGGANVLATSPTISGLNITGTLSTSGNAGSSGQVLTTTGAGGWAYWSTPAALPNAGGIKADTPLVADGYGNVGWSTQRGYYYLTSGSATRIDETPNANAVTYLLYAISGSRHRSSEVSILYDYMGPSVTERNVMTRGSAITGFTVSADSGMMGTGPGLVITTSLAATQQVNIYWYKTAFGESY